MLFEATSGPMDDAEVFQSALDLELKKVIEEAGGASLLDVDALWQLLPHADETDALAAEPTDEEAATATSTGFEAGSEAAEDDENVDLMLLAALGKSEDDGSPVVAGIEEFLRTAFSDLRSSPKQKRAEHNGEGRASLLRNSRPSPSGAKNAFINTRHELPSLGFTSSPRVSSSVKRSLSDASATASAYEKKGYKRPRQQQQQQSSSQSSLASRNNNGKPLVAAVNGQTLTVTLRVGGKRAEPRPPQLFPVSAPTAAAAAGDSSSNSMKTWWGALRSDGSAVRRIPHQQQQPLNRSLCATFDHNQQLAQLAKSISEEFPTPAKASGLSLPQCADDISLSQLFSLTSSSMRVEKSLCQQGPSHIQGIPSPIGVDDFSDLCLVDEPAFWGVQ